VNPVYGQSVQSAGEFGSYPVNVTYPAQQSYNRFWAIPVVGYVVKWIILIPHLLILAILGYVLPILTLVTWIPVLASGQYPNWGYGFFTGYIRWSNRVQAFMWGLSDLYPSFGFADQYGYADTTALFVYPERPSRFFAIPIVGIVAKMIMLIPHFVILYALLLLSVLAHLLTWIPVLTTGQYPDWGRNLVGGTIRWYSRVMAYTLGITDQYPPFKLGE
jgi:hypothetical protein